MDLFGSHIIGTPAAISCPICNSSIPSPFTTAPEVSPPAETIFLKSSLYNFETTS